MCVGPGVCLMLGWAGIHVARGQLAAACLWTARGQRGEAIHGARTGELLPICLSPDNKYFHKNKVTLFLTQELLR